MDYGDRDFLLWIAKRMVHVYGLPRNHMMVDRVVEIAAAIPPERVTPAVALSQEVFFLHRMSDRGVLARCVLLLEAMGENPSVDFAHRLRSIARTSTDSRAFA